MTPWPNSTAFLRFDLWLHCWLHFLCLPSPCHTRQRLVHFDRCRTMRYVAWPWSTAPTCHFFSEVSPHDDRHTMLFHRGLVSMITLPRCSMYGIFNHIWVVYWVNVGKHAIHGASGLHIAVSDYNGRLPSHTVEQRLLLGSRSCGHAGNVKI